MNNKYENVPIFNPAKVEELKNSLPEEAALEVIQEFFRLTKENMDAALKSLKNEEYAAFGEHCHKIKSNAGTIGGERLSSMCADIQNFAKDDATEQTKAIKKDFLSCCEETIRVISVHIGLK